MALVNNTGADGRTQSLEAPCVRASFRPQTIILDDNEVFYLAEGEAFSDSIPRIFLISAINTTAGADAVAEVQTALVHIFQEHVIVREITPLDAASQAALISAATDSTAGTSGDLTVGYDATVDVYFLRNDVADNLLVSVTRIDGFTQDLVAETA